MDKYRRHVSLLLANGHASARQYPLGMVQAEAEIVTERINRQMVSESLLMQACVGTVLGGKEGITAYQKMIKGLTDG